MPADNLTAYATLPYFTVPLKCDEPMGIHRVFISYHHANDQWAKDELQKWNKEYKLFTDMSVNTNEVDDNLSSEQIRQVIRDNYLRDSTVTIVLVGTGTSGRKHVDWEIYSSMFDGKINKKSGILVIQLPSINPQYFTAAHEVEKKKIYGEVTSWTSVSDRAEYERRYPYLPSRLIDNLLAPKAKVSVTTWSRFQNDLSNLVTMIDAAYDDRSACEYDLSRELRRANS